MLPVYGSTNETEKNAFANFNYVVFNLQCYKKGFKNGGMLRPLARQILASFLCHLRSAVDLYSWAHPIIAEFACKFAFAAFKKERSYRHISNQSLNPCLSNHSMIVVSFLHLKEICQVVACHKLSSQTRQ